jgi:ubiquinone/menaquinone biosynthesis C-methylase UbiE
MSSGQQHGSLAQLFDSRATGESYAKHRPRYPAHVYDRVLAFAALPRLGLAADLGCGSGQVCADLAQRFERVLGIDASAEQLRLAHQAPNVEYKQCTAEATGLPAQSVDLITAAAALHWCEIPAVYREARRILKPGGAFAAWSYTGHQQELDCPAAQAVWQQLLEQFWPHWHPRLQKLMLRGYKGDEPTGAGECE